jgi:hypothetical protein
MKTQTLGLTVLVQTGCLREINKPLFNLLLKNQGFSALKECIHTGFLKLKKQTLREPLAILPKSGK